MLAGRSLKILVADDNEINLKVIIAMLELAGHDVDSADGGEAVLRALKHKHYQLLILDCMMPGLDGFQVARIIRAGDGSLWDPGLPILAVTALAAEQDRRRCLEAGMTGFCSKPIQAKTLFAWIANHFEFHELPSKKAASLPAKPSASPVETAKGPARQGNRERELIRQMSGMLIRDATDWQPQLRKLLASNNRNELAMLAHKIKGTADVLGFPELSESATKLEKSGKDGNASTSSTQVAKVIADLQQVIEDVQRQS